MRADVDAGVGVAGDAEQLDGVASWRAWAMSSAPMVRIPWWYTSSVVTRVPKPMEARIAVLLAASKPSTSADGSAAGIALGLCIGEHVGVIGALGVHARQDVVGGAVEDAGDGQDLVAHQIVLKRAHDGDAAAAAGLALNLHAARACLLGKRLDVTSRALLAETTCLPCSKAVVKISVAGCSPPISSTTMSTAGSVTTSCQSLVKATALNACRLGLLPGKRAGAGQLKVDAVGCQVLIVVALDQTGDAAADGSQTDQADVHGAQGFAHR